VIFLLGWGGGSLQDLDDIAGFYRLAYPAAVLVRLTCNAKGGFGLRCECAYGIRAASHTWARAPQGSKKRLLVHLFSNAGFMTWTEMLQSWAAVSTQQEAHPLLSGPLPAMSDVLRGVVLDSACNSKVAVDACIQSHVQAMAGFMCQVAASVHDGSEAGIKSAEMTSKKVLLQLLANDSPVKAHLATKPSEEMTSLSAADAKTVHDLEPPVPVQFVYSKDDTIISCAGIEEYISEVASRPNRQGCEPPKSLVFERSKHVFHKVKHRDEYAKCVKSFASSVLE